VKKDSKMSCLFLLIHLSHTLHKSVQPVKLGTIHNYWHALSLVFLGHVHYPQVTKAIQGRRREMAPPDAI